MSGRKRVGWSSSGKNHSLVERERLSFEQLEELTLLSTTPSPGNQTDWRDETFSIGSLDQAVYANTASSLSQSALPLVGGQQEQQQYGYTGAGYSVAIIDTGIDYNNPAFAGHYLGGWNFVANNSNPMDDNGHGTHVAGIIASNDPNHPGIAPGVGIIALKVLDSTGTGSFGNVDLALQWVAAHQQQYHIAAVNMSLGTGNFASSEPWTDLDSDLQTLRNDGVFVAASSGNSYYSYGSQQGLAFPAINNLVVSVGAVWNGSYGSVTWADGAEDYTTAADQITSFTQRSSQLDILAPGAFITSTYLNNTFASMAGTSMAAPVVTGAAIDILQALNAEGDTAEATPQGILSIMQSTGVSIVDAGHGQDNVTHTGETYKRLNLLAAIQEIVGAGGGNGGTTQPAQPAQPTTDPTITYVDALYHQILGRAGDPGGLDSWASKLEAGLPRYDFVKLLWDSAEHRAEQVAADYQEFLHRSAAAGDINYWVGVFEAGASEKSVVNGFIHSPEFLNSHPDNAGFLQEVFQDVLGETLDAASINSLSAVLNAGISRSQLVDFLLNSPQRTAYVIGQYYQQFLGRPDSAAEEQNWANLINSGAVDFESVAEMFLSSDEYFSNASAHDHSAEVVQAGPITPPIVNDAGAVGSAAGSENFGVSTPASVGQMPPATAQVAAISSGSFAEELV
jgi:subtilisin family serine protease